MASKLVIVESPAKAKTIGGYLGSDYEVEASIGHIRDLPENGSKLPPELKKQWWSQFAVDIDNDFTPLYEVTPEKLKQVSKLRGALKGKTELVLATDEDREGESISWHLLEVLKPSKSVKIKRIAFHEITKDAIKYALDHPRQIDQDLVEAQEARRVLDRLFGYTLSPILWTKIRPNLSAGRVQTPAVKLIVDREKERMQFREAAYWDLTATLETAGKSFPAVLKQINSVAIAGSQDFEPTTGQLKPGKKVVRHLLESEAKSLAELSAKASPWTVESLEQKEVSDSPKPPFMTTTLQQEANRKFGWSGEQTMRIAQGLYEGVTVNGQLQGLITYMRTDSLNLASTAVDGLRSYIRSQYPDCLPDKSRTYSSKVRNAQEAHEAIRPTDPQLKPDALSKSLTAEQFKLYDLIWKRTVACQMKPALTLQTTAQIKVSVGQEALTFQANGQQVLFDGYRRVYQEGIDESDSDLDDENRILPPMAKGNILNCQKVNAVGHSTKPPSRYTEATLIKALEQHGVGRPSTYASILGVIGPGRNYVRKVKNYLVPTFKAFLVMDLLENHFQEFASLDFTRQMDESLDEIAEGKSKRSDYLKDFFLGNNGLKTAVDTRKAEIPFPAFHLGKHPETGEDIVIRISREGDAFLQQGPRESKKFASIPEDTIPADLTIARAVELLDGKKGKEEPFGIDPVTGRNLLLKNRGGYYLQVEQTEEEIESKTKPRFISLPNVSPFDLSQDDIHQLCLLPRTVGKNPQTGEDILYKMGKFGGYLESGTERRTLPNWRDGFMISVGEAVAILAAPKGKTASAGPAILKDFGTVDGAQIKVISGRFGAYVSDGTTNATLPKGTDPISLELVQAQELLQKKREAGPSQKPSWKKTAKKSAAPKSVKRKTKK